MPLNPKRFWWWFNLIDQATFLRTQESKKQGLLKKRPSDNTNFIYKEQRNECLKAGRDWGQEEKGTTEDETAGWHHQLYGHEFEWTPGVGDGQGGRQCLPLEKAMAPHSSTLAWKIPWMEEPGMPQLLKWAQYVPGEFRSPMHCQFPQPLKCPVINEVFSKMYFKYS